MINEKNSKLEKTLLVVDDQWGTENGKDVIIAAWGNLSEPQQTGFSYKFRFEDALEGDRYCAEKVLTRLNSESKIDGIILDLDYGSDWRTVQRGYGEIILQRIKSEYQKLPIWIHSSTDDESLKSRCIQKGAEGCIPKKMWRDDLKKVLDVYFQKQLKGGQEK